MSIVETVQCVGKNIACALFILACLSSADACSRFPSEGTDKHIDLEKASFVFRGLVTKVELVELVPPSASVFLTKVPYKPTETLKGDVPEDGYIVSHTGYMGGCSVPVLVGLEYLFAPQKGDIIFDFEESSELYSFLKNSIGMISIFNTTQLPSYKPRLDEAMAEVRRWAAKRN